MTEIHVATEKLEQEVIAFANSLPGLKHEFGDCGHLDNNVSGIEHHILFGNVDEIISGLKADHYANCMLSLQMNRNSSEFKSMLQSISAMLEKHAIPVAKADTTFVSGKDYALIAFTHKGKSRRINVSPTEQVIASIDSYVENRHFRPVGNKTNPGFYSACASISDIGAAGGMPFYLHVALINPKKDDFMDGVHEAAKFCHIDLVEKKEYHNPELGEFAAIFTVMGKVEKAKEMTLKGLKKGMDVYVAGRVGISKATDYNTPKEHLMQNLSPAFRKQVFDAITSEALCSDVSDGVEKCLHNILRNSQGLQIKVRFPYLADCGHNSFGLSVCYSDILHGGDDYALVIATKSDLSRIHGVTRIGKVEQGENKIVYR
jgi:thiamine monophosphate kinase